jgi:hypothetical protein
MAKKLTEQWRNIPGWDDYQVSNFGRVRSFKWNLKRILKPNTIGGDYLQVTFRKEGKRKAYLVSRLAATCFIPNPKKKPTVNHIDFDKSNNRVTNLEWATVQENLYHAIIHEMMNKKLNHSQVAEIKSLGGTMTVQKIADRFNVSISMVSHILKGNRRQVLNTS